MKREIGTFGAVCICVVFLAVLVVHRLFIKAGILKEQPYGY